MVPRTCVLSVLVQERFQLVQAKKVSADAARRKIEPLVATATTAATAAAAAGKAAATVAAASAVATVAAAEDAVAAGKASAAAATATAAMAEDEPATAGAAGPAAVVVGAIAAAEEAAVAGRAAGVAGDGVVEQQAVMKRALGANDEAMRAAQKLKNAQEEHGGEVGCMQSEETIPGDLSWFCTGGAACIVHCQEGVPSSNKEEEILNTQAWHRSLDFEFRP
jgi:hypothetical protein